MNPNRKSPQKFDNMWDLITELNAAGHPNHKLWYNGQIRDGEEQIDSPRCFVSAACRLIGQRSTDGRWTALFGYDDPVPPGGAEPDNAYNLAEMQDALELSVPGVEHPNLENK